MSGRNGHPGFVGAILQPLRLIMLMPEDVVVPSPMVICIRTLVTPMPVLSVALVDLEITFLTFQTTITLTSDWFLVGGPKSCDRFAVAYTA